jgi:hypothetical protein
MVTPRITSEVLETNDEIYGISTESREKAFWLHYKQFSQTSIKSSPPFPVFQQDLPVQMALCLKRASPSAAHCTACFG